MVCKKVKSKFGNTKACGLKFSSKKAQMPKNIKKSAKKIGKLARSY